MTQQNATLDAFFSPAALVLHSRLDVAAAEAPEVLEAEAGAGVAAEPFPPTAPPTAASPRQLRVFSRKRRAEAPAESAAVAGAAAAEAPSAATVAAALPARPPARFKQLHLDAGQSDFGHATCARCGMVYARGEDEDERLHAAFHAALLEPPAFRGWAAERVAWRCAAAPPRRVLHVAPGDPAAHWARVRALGDVAAAALGLPPSWLLQAGAHAFIAVSAAGRVEGLLVAEALAEARRLLPGCAVLRCQRQPQPAGGGVRAVWVHPAHRRAGTARRLLDAARAGLLAGAVLPRELLAFSQPTPEGRALAAAYSGTEAFLVYGG